jgi:uncharacterized YigZ family protein
MNDYLSVAGLSEYSYEVSRSLFVCRLFPADTLEEGQKSATGIRKRFPDATHHCYAFIGPPDSGIRKCSDDGEPQGTAGQPILAVLAKHNLYAVCAVVTRYFGGIKLGAGGLTGAYTKAAAGAVESAKIIKYVWSAVFRAELTYGEYTTAEKRFRESNIKVLKTIFDTQVTTEFAVPYAEAEKISCFLEELTSGKQSQRIINNQYILY